MLLVCRSTEVVEFSGFFSNSLQLLVYISESPGRFENRRHCFSSLISQISFRFNCLETVAPQHGSYYVVSQKTPVFHYLHGTADEILSKSGSDTIYADNNHTYCSLICSGNVTAPLNAYLLKSWMEKNKWIESRQSIQLSRSRKCLCSFYTFYTFQEGAGTQFGDVAELRIFSIFLDTELQLLLHSIP